MSVEPCLLPPAARIEAVDACARAAHEGERLARKAIGLPMGPRWRQLEPRDQGAWRCFVEAVLGGADVPPRDRCAALVIAAMAQTLGLPFREKTGGGIENIAAAVASRRGVPVDVLRGRARTRPVSQARGLMMLLAHQAKVSTPQIGRYLGRDHSTVLDVVRRIKAKAKRDHRLRADLDHLQALLGLGEAA